jgi:hypothetical protein
MTLLAPPVDRVLGPLPGNEGEVVYGSWLMARLVLLPKKGDLSLCRNWRGICLLDISSKILSNYPGKLTQSGLVSKRYPSISSYLR